ncbi:hypothetical protein C8R44DRAFT_890240 [Mycena epipterygia]|nr:hypothetical protein C8R44DRAFT_890240 [Mycena epipterygia]
MVFDYNITLSQDTLVMVPISSQHTASIAAKNFKSCIHRQTIFTSYVRHRQHNSRPNVSPGLWCRPVDGWRDPFKTWQKSYTFNPLAGLSSDQAHLVLGGQELLWTEQSDAQNLDPIAWLHAASSAETF